MKKQRLLLALLLISCSHSGGRGSDKASTILDDLARDRIVKVEVNAIVIEKLFNEAVTAARLASDADLRTSFDPRTDALHRWMLERILQNSRRFETDQGPRFVDVRWGFILYGPSGDKLHSVYIDRWMKSGLLDETSAAFDPSIKWPLTMIRLSEKRIFGVSLGLSSICALLILVIGGVCLARRRRRVSRDANGL